MNKRNQSKRSVNRSNDRLESVNPTNGEKPISEKIEGITGRDGDSTLAGQSPCVMTEETYARERSCLIEIEQKSADQHDKAILTLTSGALGLSITFLDKIAPNPLPETLWVIGVSWSCFIIGIFSILASFLTSQAACRRQRELLDAEYSTGTAPEQANHPATATRWLNSISYVLVVVGMAFLASFSWFNLKQKGEGVVKLKNSSALAVSAQNREERGIVPPKLPAPKPSTTTSNNPTPKK